MERYDELRSVEILKDGTSSVADPRKAAVDAGMEQGEQKSLSVTFVPDSAVVQGNVAQWLTFQEARVLALTNRQNYRAMKNRISLESFAMEMYGEVITVLGLSVQQFLREFPFVPKVTPPIPGIIAFRRTKDFMNGNSHVCIRPQRTKDFVFIVTLQYGKIDGCMISAGEPEVDYEDYRASCGYPGLFFRTIQQCSQFLRERYTDDRREISMAASFREFIERFYRPASPSLD